MDTALDLEYIIENTMAATYDVPFLLGTLPIFIQFWKPMFIIGCIGCTILSFIVLKHGERSASTSREVFVQLCISFFGQKLFFQIELELISKL